LIVNERQYREHWATLTGRPVREVYVPRALASEGEEAEGDRPLNLREAAPEPPLDSVQEMLDSLSNDDIRRMLGGRTSEIAAEEDWDW
jgi:hypothetical protein